MSGIDSNVFGEEEPESQSYDFSLPFIRQEDWTESKEESKYNQSEEEHKESETSSVPKKGKYESYLPDEEKRQELRERFVLDTKTTILSEMVPNKYTGSIGIFNIIITYRFWL